MSSIKCFLIHRLVAKYPVLKKLFPVGAHFATYNTPTVTRHCMVYDIQCTCGAQYKIIKENDSIFAGKVKIFHGWD